MRQRRAVVRAQRPLVLLAVTLSLPMAASSCGSGARSSTGANAPAVPHDTAQAAVVPQTAVAAAPADQLSQPWWQKVTTYRGDASMNTAAFDISSRAVQWRLLWRCQSGSFVVQPMPRSGSEQMRQLVQVPSCSGQDGQAFATNSGGFVLKITASAPWQLDIEQQVDFPLVEDPLPQMTAPGTSIVARGGMYNVDHNGRGTAKIYRFPNGTSELRLEDFFVTPTVDLQLRLSQVAAPKTTAEVAGAPFKNIAFLKATAGSMSFPVPADVDIKQFHSLVIWCELTQNAYAAAALSG